MTDLSPVIAALEEEIADMRHRYRMNPAVIGTLATLDDIAAMLMPPEPKCSVPVDTERCVDRFMYLYLNYLGTQLRQTWARG